jgi:hypothetical protein
MGIKKVPFNYEHPNKKKREKSEPAQQATAPAVSGVVPKTEKRQAKPKETDAAEVANTGELRETEMIRLVAYPPLSGQIDLYDKMVKGGLSSKQAILGILKRNFGQFEDLVFSGKVSIAKTEVGKNGEAVETNRSVSKEFLARAKEVYDPFGVLSKRALGMKIGEGILHQAKVRGSNDQ